MATLEDEMLIYCHKSEGYSQYILMGSNIILASLIMVVCVCLYFTINHITQAVIYTKDLGG